MPSGQSTPASKAAGALEFRGRVNVNLDEGDRADRTSPFLSRSDSRFAIAKQPLEAGSVVPLSHELP
jgi:hypothetical protein